MRHTLSPVLLGTSLLAAAATAAAGPQRLDLLNPQGEILLKDVVVHRGPAAILEARRRGIAVELIDPLGERAVLEAIRNGHPIYREVSNVDAADTSETDRLWPGGSSGHDLDGSGVVVGVWDGGLPRTSHQEFDGGAWVGESGDLSNHATHVTGTIKAIGLDITAQGMAPAANTKGYDFLNDEIEMIAEAQGGLRLSNHSYGTRTGWRWDGSWQWWGDTTVSLTEDYLFGFYNEEAQAWDQIAHDNPRYLICKSAGNDRNEGGPAAGANYWIFINGDWVQRNQNAPGLDGNNGFDCVPTYSCSKNIVTVGAVDDITVGYFGPSDVVMSTFSGWGPTDDGRIKPDIVANGVGLWSTGSASDSTYYSEDGTSMSCPTVTGAAALLLQLWRQTHSSDPWSSSMKAVMIHTAYEAGANPGPDYSFGWGLLNAHAAADLIEADGAITWRIQEVTLQDGEVFEMPIEAAGAGPVCATIVWTDVPGTPPATQVDPTTLMLVNDLDLRIVEDVPGGDVHRPWILDPANPADAATTGDNFRDNVEQVEATLVDGRHVIRVSHKGSLDGGSQTFSLVISGAVRGVERLYVDDDGPDGSGSSWADSMRELGDAIHHARIRPGNQYEIWVAAGEYEPIDPTEAGDFRSRTFELLRNTAIYGGFAGNEPFAAERDPSTNITVLTGDFNGNDVPGEFSAGRSDNAYHVVYCDDSTSFTVLDGFVIRGGHADGAGPNEDRGGGLLAMDAVRLDRLVFEDNYADEDGGGASIESDGVDLRRSSFIGNEARYGGGLSIDGVSTCMVYRCDFDQNRGEFGGGMRLTGSYADLFDLRFRGNFANFGGGLYAQVSSNPTVNNCEFSGNHASNRGGALRYITSSIASLFNCTIANNTVAIQGGGGGVHSLNSTFGALNCSFWGNEEPTGGGADGQIIISGGASLLGNCIVEGGWAGSTNIDADPQFVNPLGWDGVAGTPDDNLRVLHSSPCIDSGLFTGVADKPDLDNDGNTTEAYDADLLGHDRQVGPAYDIGAHEHDPDNPSVVYVRSDQVGLRDGKSWQLAYAELESGLNLAKGATKPVEVWIKHGTYVPSDEATPSDPRSASFRPASGVAVVGGFSGGELSPAQRPAGLETILSGDIDGDDKSVLNNAYHVVDVSGTSAATVLADLTITAGVATGSLSSQRNGGGIYSDGGAARLIRLTVFSNQAATHGGGMYSTGSAAPTLEAVRFIANYAESLGGGLYDRGAATDLVHCEFVGNAAGSGGAIRSFGADTTAAWCRFLGNRADSGAAADGGAVYVGSSARTEWVNCEFSGNTSSGDGGAVSLVSGSALFTSCTLAGNMADQNAGGVFSIGSGNDLSMINSIVWGNTGAGSASESWQIEAPSGAVDIDWSLVQLWTGTLPGSSTIAGNPRFADPDGPDGMPGTEDDDLTLAPGSAAVDAGHSGFAPSWLLVDLGGLDRIVDAANYTDTGNNGQGSEVVDMGAHEAPAGLAPGSGCPGDIDGDGDTDTFDFAELALAFGTNPGETNWNPAADLIPDGTINTFDFAELAEDFGCN